MVGRLALPLRLRFPSHAPQQLANGLAFHQKVADEVGGGITLAGLANKDWWRAWRAWSPCVVVVAMEVTM